MKKKVQAKQRVVVIHNVISPHVTPVFQELAKKVNLTVLYCTETEKNRQWKEKPHGFQYEVLPHFLIATFVVNPSLTRVLKELQPDVVIISGWDLWAYQMAAGYCAYQKIPYILWSGSTDNEKSWRRVVAWPLVQLMVRGAAGYIAYGSQAQKYLQNLGAKASKISIAYNTVDLKKYLNISTSQKKTATHLKKKLNIGKKRVVLYYGQLIQRKRVDVLIRAFAELKKSYPASALVIMGTGDRREELEQLVAQLRLADVTFISDPGDNAMPAYYQLADVFVLPSEEEVWGLVVNQAMASGVPVIASRAVGSVSDLITDGQTVYTFDVNSVPQLTKKLLLLFQNERLRKRIVQEAKKTILITDVEEAAKQIAQRVTVSQQKILQLIHLPTIEDDCKLSVAAHPQIPFSIARAYYIYDAEPDLSRGLHAHKETQQVLVCLRGSVKIIVDDGRQRAEVILTDPSIGVFFDKMIWHEMREFTDETLLLVFASKPYDEDDYIRSYDEFKKRVESAV